MIEQIKHIQDEALAEIRSSQDPKQLEQVRVKYLGKKGSVTALLHKLGKLEPDERREMGQVLNETKKSLENSITGQQEKIRHQEMHAELTQSEPLDATLPGQYTVSFGSLHPVSRIQDEMVEILRRVGFSIASGPEIELEFYNFEALNTPDNHPARDLQDTFYIESPVLLRSHTSPVQIRSMLQKKPPIQLIAIGKVYRADYDSTHTPMFHQMEGLMVDEHISFADLKGVLHYLVRHLFGQRKLRFRPSYFPFTEPSAEVDMECIQCRGRGEDCRMCGSTGWLEIGGAGMVHPNVFRAVKYDPDNISGFAFGLGIERMAMLKYGISDIRALFENDYRMLEQF